MEDIFQKMSTLVTNLVLEADDKYYVYNRTMSEAMTFDQKPQSCLYCDSASSAHCKCAYNCRYLLVLHNQFDWFQSNYTLNNDFNYQNNNNNNNNNNFSQFVYSENSVQIIATIILFWGDSIWHQFQYTINIKDTLFISITSLWEHNILVKLPIHSRLDYDTLVIDICICQLAGGISAISSIIIYTQTERLITLDLLSNNIHFF